MRATRPSSRASTAWLMARNVLPVPAGPLATTRMACPSDELNAQAVAYAEALAAATTWNVEPNGTLDRERWARACGRAAGWIPELSSLTF